MPTRRVAVRHVREILRLSLDGGLSTRVIGERVGIGPTTVRDTLRRFGWSGLKTLRVIAFGVGAK
jgi:transposase